MKKSFTTTLVMTGCLVLLLAWYLIYDKKIQPEHHEAEEKSKELVTFESGDIQELEIDRLKNRPTDNAPAPKGTPEYEKIKLKKAGDTWNLIEPVQDAADTGTVKSLLNSLTTTKQERVIEDKAKDLGQYGLDAPAVKVIARKDEKTPTQELDLGKNTPVGYSTYAKVAGHDPVYKIPRSLLNSVDKDAKSFRNKQISGLQRFEVAEVDIQGPKKLDLVLKKDDKDNWQLSRENMPADNNEWNKTLNALVDLKANDFVDNADDLATYGLENPLYRINLVKTNNKGSVTLLLGQTKNTKVYAKRADKPTVYEVDRAILDKVSQSPEKYRSHQLANFNRFDIDRVNLSWGKNSLELAKDNGKWMVPTDPKLKIDAPKVDDFLTKLQDTKIANYAPEPAEKHQVKVPSLVVKLFAKQDKTDKEKVSLIFGEPHDGQVLVQRSDLAIPFLIKQDDFSKINRNEKDFREAETKTPDSAPVSAERSPKKS